MYLFESFLLLWLGDSMCLSDVNDKKINVYKFLYRDRILIILKVLW